MSRSRALVAAASVAVFVVVVGIVIYANGHQGGQARTFDVSVTGGAKMSPSTLEPAHVGDTITINVKSDRDGEMHLHGYDIAFELKSDETVSKTFKADRTCTCLIEWERTGAPLGNLVVSP